MGWKPDFFGGLPGLFLVLPPGGVEFDPVVAEFLQETKFFFQGLALPAHAALQREQDGMRPPAFVVIGGYATKASGSGKGSSGEEAAAIYRLHGITRDRGGVHCKP